MADDQHQRCSKVQSLAVADPLFPNWDAFYIKVWYQDAFNYRMDVVKPVFHLRIPLFSLFWPFCERHRYSLNFGPSSMLAPFYYHISKTSRFRCMDWRDQVSACSDFSGPYQGLLSSLIVAEGRLFEPICNWIFVGMQGFEPWFSEPKSSVLAITLHPKLYIVFNKLK